MGNHYDVIINKPVTNQQLTMANIGIDNFNILEVVKTTDYYLEYILQHPNIPASKANVIRRILQLFTQYEARAIEQAIIHATQPDLNTSQTVLFTTKWAISDLMDSDNSQPITAIGKDSSNI